MPKQPDGTTCTSKAMAGNHSSELQLRRLKADAADTILVEYV
jgi:hypothetical protein